MAMITGTHNISEMLTAHTIMGTKVVNQAGENLGEVKDLAIGLDKGCINYAVLEFGGFLGMGEKLFAIPWQAFTVDQDNERLVLNVPKEKLENAPGFDNANWPDFADQTWMQQTNSYYGYGTQLDFQRDLGLSNNQTLWRIDGSWRFTPRQQIYFSYLDLNQDGSRDIARNIQWGNNVYYAGAHVEGEWKTQQLNAYYRFSFVQGDKGEFGGSIGLSWVDQKAKLQGWGQVAGTMTSYYAVKEASVSAPVPVIGLFGTWQFNSQWSMTADVNYLKLNVSENGTVLANQIDQPCLGL